MLLYVCDKTHIQDGVTSCNASPNSKANYFSQFLQNPLRPTNGTASHYIMVVMLVAIFFVNPFTLSGYGGRNTLRTVPHSTGSVRTINAYEADYDMLDAKESPVDAMMYIGFWMLRVLVAAVCFGWMTLKAMPRVVANSQDSVQFWRFRKQAEKDLEEVRLAHKLCGFHLFLCCIPPPPPFSGGVYECQGKPRSGSVRYQQTYASILPWLAEWTPVEYFLSFPLRGERTDFFFNHGIITHLPFFLLLPLLI